MVENSNQIRVRFAPSPTGFLHVGGLRTALYNFLFAKQNNGQFILRIEDTDRARFVKGAEENILETLKTFGLNLDEEPIRQSEHLEKYKKYADELIGKDLAYQDEGAIRFKMPKEGTTAFEDIIRGRVEFENKDQEDFVLIKSDGFPTYNFAHVVDDHDMDISHVIRGEEFIPSVPKYIALHKAFGWIVPIYAHLPLLLNKSRAKLSKREGDVAVTDFLEKGYLVEALTNFIALLGWHPSKSEKEIFSLEELIKEFRLEDVQKGGAIFDLDKLDWFQKVWSVKLAEGKLPQDHPLFEKVKQVLGDTDVSLLEPLWPHIIERITSPNDLANFKDEFGFFFEEPSYQTETLVWKKSDKGTTKKVLQELKELLSGNDAWEDTENKIKQFIADRGYDNGTVLWPLRVALTGKDKSIGPFEIIDVLNQSGNREVVIQRINKAIDSL